MQIKINGGLETVSEKRISIATLLEIKDVESPEMVSVQLNGNIVDRADYGQAEVSDNDEVEFLYFMGGGSGR